MVMKIKIMYCKVYLAFLDHENACMIYDVRKGMWNFHTDRKISANNRSYFEECLLFALRRYM
jgi:hypothetical protein